MSLKEENPSISEDLLVLASKSNYYKPPQDIKDIEDKFVKKIRLLDPNYKA
tara:strand:+ start:1404 stop:1556 length:153 start_codon:yes stop_codon:yes gene_type:complete